MNDLALPKWVLKSWTIILNALVLLATIVVEFSSFGPDLGVDPKHVVMALAVANFVLRFKTERPVTLSKREADVAKSLLDPKDPYPMR